MSGSFARRAMAPLHHWQGKNGRLLALLSRVASLVGTSLALLGAILILGTRFQAPDHPVPIWLAGTLAALGSLLAHAGARLRYYSRRFRSAASVNTPARGGERIVLYLRPFSVDQLARHGQMGSQEGLPPLPVPDVFTEEEQLAIAMADVGRLVALGRPGESLPPLGAARTYVDDQTWHQEVIELIDNARLVVLSVGLNGGVLWELEQVTVRCRPEAILVLISLDRSEYDRFREEAGRYFPKGLPPYMDSSRRPHAHSLRAFVHFDVDWTPHLETFPRIDEDDVLATVDPKHPLVPLFRLAFAPVFSRLGIPYPVPATYRVSTRERTTQKIQSLAAVLVLLVGLGLWGWQTYQDSTPAGKAIAEFTKWFTERSALPLGGQTKEKMADVVRAGWPYLSDGRLIEMAELQRKALSRLDTATCAAVGRGAYSWRMILNALKGSEIDEFVSIFRDAVAIADVRAHRVLRDPWLSLRARSLGGGPNREPLSSPGLETLNGGAEASPTLADAIFALSAVLRPEDLARFASGLTGETSTIPDADICAMTRTLHDALQRLDPPHRGIIARAIVHSGG